MGRQTLIPAADTTNPAGGTITVVYDHTDAARTISQDTTSVAFTLDGAGRRLQQTTTMAGVTSGVVTRHYTDGGDNPTWSVDTTGGQTVTTRYAALTGDGLGVTFSSTPTDDGAELTLTGLRGDIAANVALDGDTPAGGIGSWTEYTEYGQPATTNPPAADTSVTPIGYSLAFGGFSLWGGLMAGTRWVRLGEETVVAPLHGRIRWVDVEAVNVDEVTGTAFFPRTAVILSVAGSKGMRRVALTEVSRKIGNPATDALAIE